MSSGRGFFNAVPTTVAFSDRDAVLRVLKEHDDSFDWDQVIASYRDEVRYFLTRRYERDLWDRAVAPWIMRRRWRRRPSPTRQSVLRQVAIVMPPAIAYSVEAASAAGGSLCADIRRHAPSPLPASRAVRYTPRDELLKELAPVSRSLTARASYEEHRLLAIRSMPKPSLTIERVARVALGDTDVTGDAAERYAVLRGEVEALEERARSSHHRATERLAAEIERDAIACDDEDERRALSSGVAERLNQGR